MWAPCSSHQPQRSALDRREQLQSSHVGAALWLTHEQTWGRGYSPPDLLVSTFPPSHPPNPQHHCSEVSVGIGFYSDLDQT